MNPKRIAIIGGGFSAIAVAYNLVQMGINIGIDIFDNEHFENNGKAYTTSDTSHVLNVPADKMGLPFDDEEHFYNWLKEIIQINKDSFVPRSFYRLYLQEIISELKINANLNFIKSTISKISFSNNQYILSSSDEIFRKYDYVVLATGLKVRKLSENLNNERIVEDIWSFFNKRKLPKSGNVLVIGTGLTMIDAALSFKNSNFQGKIIACSGSARLPLPHSIERTKTVKTLEASDANLPLSQILNRLRIAAKNNHDWQSIIHGLRPITSEMWQQFDLKKKKRFLRHLMGFWSIHRHRVSRNNDTQIIEMIELGKLRITKGRLAKIEEKNKQIIATLNNGKIIEADLVLNATGFDFSGRDCDLINNLLEEKIIIRHETNLGFKTTKDHPNLYLMGSLLTGELLEITAIPELRALSHKVASEIFSSLGGKKLSLTNHEGLI